MRKKPLVLKIPTIAITGSAGKTTVKEMVASILEQKWNVFKSKRNRNQRHHTKQHRGAIKPYHQAVVLEFAMGRKKAGKVHCSHIQPNIGVITNIGFAHFGMLGNNIKLTAESKSALIKYMKPDGILFINGDDENSKLLKTKGFKGEIITIGVKNLADYQAQNIKYLGNGMSFDVKLDDKTENFFLPAFGQFNVINALFSIAICHRLKFTAPEIRLGLRCYEVPDGRLNHIELKNQIILLDDTFNANPQAVKAAVDVLLELGKEKIKMVILGSMLELGDYSITGHEEVGRYLADNKIDLILTYGEKAKWICTCAANNGHAKTWQFEERALLHNWLEKNLQPNTAILVKGSNRMAMKKTVEYLQQKFAKPL